jgi:starvation-inducible DNA-binding protein
MIDREDVASRRGAALTTPTALGTEARKDISGELNALLADFVGPELQGLPLAA